MRLTVLGGCGAWPAADQACTGYLARGADLLRAEASYAREVPGDSARYLSSVSQAGQLAHR